MELLLKNTKYENFAGCVYPLELKNYTYRDLFRAGNDSDGFFALKIRESGRKDITDSIDILKKISDPGNFINKHIDVFEKDGYIIMISGWISGFQPIDHNRNYLPLFFSELANFNKRNKGKAPFTSMYAGGNYFNTADELIDYEVNCHLKSIRDIYETKIIKECLEELKRGIACIILEDMNTGNLIISNDGKLKFIDTEWIINGLNLYQFEKIDYFGFEERKWYNINDESRECYTAYFETMGVPFGDANEQIRAFELLQALRQNTVYKTSGEANDDEIKKRINTVLGHEKFI